MSRLTGKRALVTGGGRGIGAAVVRRLAADGASVAINYHSSAGPAQELADELGGADRGLVTVAADVSGPDGARTAVGAAVAAFGGLDILVSNAGPACRCGSSVPSPLPP